MRRQHLIISSILSFLSLASHAEASVYCSCSQVTIWSSGLTLDNQPEVLGSYSHSGSIWEDMINIYKKQVYYLTVDANSNPNFSVDWVVSTEWLSAPGDYSKVFLRSD